MNINDIYASPEKLFDSLEEAIVPIGELVSRVIRLRPEMRFYSKNIPDMPDGNLIAFLKAGNRLAFYVERGNNEAYIREIPVEDAKDFIFTPVVFDLGIADIKNTEDVLHG